MPNNLPKLWVETTGKDWLNNNLKDHLRRYQNKINSAFEDVTNTRGSCFLRIEGAI